MHLLSLWLLLNLIFLYQNDIVITSCSKMRCACVLFWVSIVEKVFFFLLAIQRKLRYNNNHFCFSGETQKTTRHSYGDRWDVARLIWWPGLRAIYSFIALQLHRHNDEYIRHKLLEDTRTWTIAFAIIWTVFFRFGFALVRYLVEKHHTFTGGKHQGTSLLFYSIPFFVRCSLLFASVSSSIYSFCLFLSIHMEVGLISAHTHTNSMHTKIISI